MYVRSAMTLPPPIKNLKHHPWPKINSLNHVDPNPKALSYVSKYNTCLKLKNIHTTGMKIFL